MERCFGRFSMTDIRFRMTRHCHADRSGGISLRAGERSFDRLRMTEIRFRMMDTTPRMTRLCHADRSGGISGLGMAFEFGEMLRQAQHD
jgi:hypothetical protein